MDGRTFNANPGEALPQQDYWGYSHHSEMRVDDVGFRVLLDVKHDHSLIERARLFDQKNKAWQTKFD